MRALNYNHIVRIYLEVLTREKRPIYMDKHGVYFMIYDEDHGKELKYVPGSDGGLYNGNTDSWDGTIDD